MVSCPRRRTRCHNILLFISPISPKNTSNSFLKKGTTISPKIFFCNFQPQKSHPFPDFPNFSRTFPDFPRKYVKKRENSRDFPNFFRNPYKNLGISGKKPQKWGKKFGISRNPEYLHFSLIMHFHLFFLTYLCSR